MFSYNQPVVLLNFINWHYLFMCTLYFGVDFLRTVYSAALTSNQWVRAIDAILVFVNVNILFNALGYFHYFVLRRWNWRLHKSRLSASSRTPSYLLNGIQSDLTTNEKPPNPFQSLFDSSYNRPLEGFSEAWNVLASSLYALSSVITLIAHLLIEHLSSSAQQRVETSTTLMDNTAMILFVLGGLLYFAVWQRFRSSVWHYVQISSQSRQLTHLLQSARSSIYVSNFLTDWMFWSNLFNLLGALVYFAATIYGIYFVEAEKVTAVSVPQEWVFVSWREMIYEHLSRQSLLYFTGDILYIICAATMICSFYQEMGWNWRRHLAGKGDIELELEVDDDWIVGIPITIQDRTAQQINESQLSNLLELTTDELTRQNSYSNQLEFDGQLSSPATESQQFNLAERSKNSMEHPPKWP